MSGAEGLSLVFFGDDQVYRVGETVSGAVQFRLSGAPNFKAVEVDFHGDCVVTLPQSDNHKSRASEQYLKHTIILWKQEVCPPLSNGDQTFQFHFTLPVNIPSSFEGKYGKVCYRAKAVLRTSWYRLNITCKKKFSILNPVNMNDLPNIDMPLTISKEKKVFYDVFHRGLVSLRVTLNQGGFVPGEQMYITINVSNDCNCELKGTVCTLRQKTTFRTSFERDENKIIEEVAGGHVGPKQQGQWQLMIVVPQIPVSNLQFCKLIDVIYFLKVSVCDVSMSVKFPICMGNNPIWRPHQAIAPQHFPYQQWAPHPGLPQTFSKAPMVFPTAPAPVDLFNTMRPNTATQFSEPAQYSNPNVQIQFQGSPGQVPSAPFHFQSPPSTAIGEMAPSYEDVCASDLVTHNK
uniref:arrestin domain-containing protein 1-like isoform X1 n=1 Tax=Myxine glutinosa TaxID=7769 RepID=UPI00358F91E7